MNYISHLFHHPTKLHSKVIRATISIAYENTLPRKRYQISRHPHWPTQRHIPLLGRSIVIRDKQIHFYTVSFSELSSGRTHRSSANAGYPSHCLLDSRVADYTMCNSRRNFEEGRPHADFLFVDRLGHKEIRPPQPVYSKTINS